MILQFKYLIFIFTLFPGSSSIESHGSTRCTRSCGKAKSVKHLNYPFGFSDSCEIRLNCTESGEIQIGEFQVQNVTPSSLFMYLPAVCNRPLDSIKSLFSHNYGFTWKNSLLFQNCSNVSNGCLIPTSVMGNRFNSSRCDSKSDNLTCISEENKEFEVLSFVNVSRLQCSFLYSSIAVDAEKEPVSMFFQAVELGWWLNGPCECSVNASCESVRVAGGGEGFRCRCPEGFQGDGFRNGTGCQKVTNCNATMYMYSQCGGTTRIGALVGGIVAGASLMATLVLICYCIKCRSASFRSRMSAKRLFCEATGNSDIPFYPYKEIERSTNGFSDKQRLGTGAYGTVYAGKLHNNEWVAIKKIKHRDSESFEQVMNEIKLLSSVSHPNLIRLLGWCIEKGKQILVYEYMPNGTLSQHLQRERGKCIPWTIRLSIASETARAIAHLHTAMNPPIYHRDIKSSNILLDYNFKSKVADFGLSRLGMTEISHISTAPQGTPGYLDPQYHQSFHLSDKSDVYSFGVVLVEIITALKVVDFSRAHTEVNLAALAVDRIGSGCLDEIIDPYLDLHRDSWTLASIHKVAELAFKCLSFHRDMRPSMVEVADELEEIRLSAWTTLHDNICMSSSAAFSSSLSYTESEKSTGPGVHKLILPDKVPDRLNSIGVEGSSPVSVQDPWFSEQSSPSTNSLLGNVIQ